MRIFKFFIAIVAVFITLTVVWLDNTVLPVATGYFAKNLCSCVFISGRSAESVVEEELSTYGYLHYRIDFEKKLVRSSFFQLGGATAVYRPGYGCTLAAGIRPQKLLSQKLPEISAAYNENDTVTDEFLTLYPPNFSVDAEMLEAAIAHYFSPDVLKHDLTRAIVVVHKGQIIAERYAEGFDRETPQLGWSMAKTVTCMLAGILDRERLLTHSHTDLFEAWTNDDRYYIAASDLMQMTSGLIFDENYDWVTDATQMLFHSYSNADYAMQKDLEQKPGHYFSYSSGSTNILSLLLRNRLNNDSDYLLLPHKSLFAPLQMKGTVLEPDASGTYVGSSFMFARPVDWAKLGQLLLNGGKWNGQQIFFPQWATLITSPSIPSEGKYGAGVWMQEGIEKPEGPLPTGTWWMGGFQGQVVAGIPSVDLVLVRMGYSPGDRFDKGEFILRMLEAFPEQHTKPI